MPAVGNAPFAWITGASSGLGLSLTQAYLERGYHVVASARREKELAGLSRLYPDALHFMPFDVTKEEEVEPAKALLEKITKRLDLVILNAGTCEYLDMDKPDWSLFDRVNQVNYMGMVRSLRVCLDLLKQTPDAHLVGVSSQAVQAPFIRSEAYGASKAASRYLLASLRLDLAPDDIDVTCIMPGFIDTPLTKRNDFPMPFLMSPDQAAARIQKAIDKRVYEYAFPKRLSAALALSKLFPKLWFKQNARETSE
ncbi:SDR family NAD(P)-dependent oxidoreductase [Marinomonas ostreistagni]|uniref:SDR family NAD(P)-dependent oxidoreductase n=1 Tax=Marinomonas ostreistagni TaxID=359209 RepID=UPI00194F59A7|nr:SDR family NAD(P)-dependent oxidoreductase [Marinomonas ostreistagni]MBM6550994.1 SDR family NAD(P)-dependent oxidoreductase [Marinomonas ostreistagni]